MAEKQLNNIDVRELHIQRMQELVKEEIQKNEAKYKTKVRKERREFYKNLQNNKNEVGEDVEKSTSEDELPNFDEVNTSDGVVSDDKKVQSDTKNKKLDERGKVKYDHSKQRKVALMSYIANFPEEVDEDKIKTLAEFGIRRYEPSETSAWSYVTFGTDVINFKNQGKFRVLEEIPQQLYLHEMLHTTSCWFNFSGDLVKLPNSERAIYAAIEEGVVESKAQRILRSSEFREMCRQNEILPINYVAYPMEQVFANVLDLLVDGQLFDAFCTTREEYDKALRSAFAQNPEMESIISMHALYGLRGEYKDYEKVMEQYGQFCECVAPLLEQKTVTKDNIIQMAYLRDCVKNGGLYYGKAWLEYDEELTQQLGKLVEVLDKKIDNFEFDKTMLTDAEKKSGKKRGEDWAKNYDYLMWLDSTGLTKVDTYAQYVHYTTYEIIKPRYNAMLYCAEAESNEVKGRRNDFEIWEKAEKIAEHRNDLENLRYISNAIDNYVDENGSRVARTPQVPEWSAEEQKAMAKKRLELILKQNKNNAVFNEMSKEEKIHYLANLNADDDVLRDVILNDFDEVNEVYKIENSNQDDKMINDFDEVNKDKKKNSEVVSEKQVGNTTTKKKTGILDKIGSIFGRGR